MNHKKFFILILILCLSFLLFSCSFSKDIDNNKKETLNIPMDLEDDTLEIIASKTVNPTETMTLTSTIMPTNTVALSLTPSITPTLTSTSTPTVTEVWRGSVPIEKFDLVREQRTDGRLKLWRWEPQLSPDESFGIVVFEDNVCELWNFDDEFIATYKESYIDVYNYYFSPDSSKFAILYLDGHLEVYNKEGYLLSVFNDVVIDSKVYFSIHDNKVQFSKNGDYITFTNEFEGLKIYRSKGIDIPNMHFVSFEVEDDIQKYKDLFAKNHGPELDDSVAWEMVMRTSHTVSTGEIVETTINDKDDKYDSEEYFESMTLTGENYHYGNYNLAYLDFSSNEKYATFFDYDNHSIIVWDFEEEKIKNYFETNILEIVSKHDGSINNEVLSRFFNTSNVFSSVGGEKISYITNNRLYIIDIESGQEKYYSHFDNENENVLLGYKILEKVNRIVTYSDGLIKIWSLDGNLLRTIDDDFRINTIKKISPNEEHIVVEKCVVDTTRARTNNCNLSVISSITGQFEITFSDSALKIYLKKHEYSVRNASSINPDLKIYYRFDGIYPTIYFNELKTSEYIFFNQDSNRIFIGSKYTSKKSFIYDLENNVIVSELPMENMGQIDYHEEKELLVLSGDWFFLKNLWLTGISVWDFDGYLIDFLPSAEYDAGTFGTILNNQKILSFAFTDPNMLTVWEPEEGFSYDWYGDPKINPEWDVFPIVTTTPTITPTPTPTITPSISPTPTRTVAVTFTPTQTPTPMIGERIWPNTSYLEYEIIEEVQIPGTYIRSEFTSDFENFLVYYYRENANKTSELMVSLFDFSGHDKNDFYLKGNYEINSLEPGLEFFRFSPDNKYYMLGDDSGKVHIYNYNGTLKSIINLYPESECNHEDLHKLYCIDPNYNFEVIYDYYGLCKPYEQNIIDKVISDSGFKMAYNLPAEEVCDRDDLEKNEGEKVIHGAFSPDSTMIVTSNENILKLWHSNGSLISTYKNYVHEISDVQFSPDGKYVIFSADHFVNVWDIKHEKLLLSFDKHLFDISDFVIVENLDDINTDKNQKRIEKREPDPIEFDILEYDRSIFTLEKHLIDIYGDEFFVRKNEILNDYERIQNDFDKYFFLPDYGILSIDSEHNIKVWDLNMDIIYEKKDSVNYNIYDVIPLPSINKFVSGNTIESMVWLFDQKDPLYIFDAHEMYIVDMDVHENGKWLATASWDGTIRIWDMQTGVLLSTIDYQYSGLDSVDFIDGTDQLVYVTNDGKIVKMQLVK